MSAPYAFRASLEYARLEARILQTANTRWTPIQHCKGHTRVYILFALLWGVLFYSKCGRSVIQAERPVIKCVATYNK